MDTHMHTHTHINNVFGSVLTAALINNGTHSAPVVPSHVLPPASLLFLLFVLFVLLWLRLFRVVSELPSTSSPCG